MPPDLHTDLHQYIHHFWQLSTCRQFTMNGPGPIPWTAIHTYAKHLGLDEYEVLYDDFVTYITSLDAEYISVSCEEIERKQKAAEKSQGSKTKW